VHPGSPARMIFVRAGVEYGVHDQLCQKALWKETETITLSSKVRILAQTKKTGCIVDLQHRIQRARKFVRQHVKPGRSLADEFIAERRAEANRESDEDENGK